MRAKRAQSDVLIVGSGLAGLMAAHSLVRRGLNVQVLDQGEHPGGRLASRHLGPGRADYGAQFFTVRDPGFGAWVNQWLAEGLVYRWATAWSSGSLDPAPTAGGHPRYAAYNGMRALAQHLAQPLAIGQAVRVVAVAQEGAGWRVGVADGQDYTARAVLLTPPVPQALALLEAGGVALDPADRARLDAIQYDPCVAALFRLDRESQVPEPGGVQRPTALIPWIADNRCKGISPDATVLTLHAGPEYSRQLWDMPDANILAALEAQLHPFKAPGTRTLETYVHRWRYASPRILYPARALVAAGLPPLVFAGDAFVQPRIEGAALSGLAAGAALAGQLA